MTNSASSEHRYWTALAISSGRPKRPHGMSCLIFSRYGIDTPGRRPTSMNPGDTTLTLMRASASSRASVWASMTRPAFEAQ